MDPKRSQFRIIRIVRESRTGEGGFPLYAHQILRTWQPAPNSPPGPGMLRNWSRLAFDDNRFCCPHTKRSG